MLRGHRHNFTDEDYVYSYDEMKAMVQDYGRAAIGDMPGVRVYMCPDTKPVPRSQAGDAPPAPSTVRNQFDFFRFHVESEIKAAQAQGKSEPIRCIGVMKVRGAQPRYVTVAIDVLPLRDGQYRVVSSAVLDPLGHDPNSFDPDLSAELTQDDDRLSALFKHCFGAYDDKDTRCRKTEAFPDDEVCDLSDEDAVEAVSGPVAISCVEALIQGAAQGKNIAKSVDSTWKEMSKDSCMTSRARQEMMTAHPEAFAIAERIAREFLTLADKAIRHQRYYELAGIAAKFDAQVVGLGITAGNVDAVGECLTFLRGQHRIDTNTPDSCKESIRLRMTLNAISHLYSRVEQASEHHDFAQLQVLLAEFDSVLPLIGGLSQQSLARVGLTVLRGDFAEHDFNAHLADDETYSARLIDLFKDNISMKYVQAIRQIVTDYLDPILDADAKGLLRMPVLADDKTLYFTRILRGMPGGSRPAVCVLLNSKIDEFNRKHGFVGDNADKAFPRVDSAEPGDLAGAIVDFRSKVIDVTLGSHVRQADAQMDELKHAAHGHAPGGWPSDVPDDSDDEDEEELAVVGGRDQLLGRVNSGIEMGVIRRGADSEDEGDEFDVDDDLRHLPVVLPLTGRQARQSGSAMPRGDEAKGSHASPASATKSFAAEHLGVVRGAHDAVSFGAVQKLFHPKTFVRTSEKELEAHVVRHHQDAEDTNTAFQWLVKQIVTTNKEKDIKKIDTIFARSHEHYGHANTVAKRLRAYIVQAQANGLTSSAPSLSEAVRFLKRADARDLIHCCSTLEYYALEQLFEKAADTNKSLRVDINNGLAKFKRELIGFEDKLERFAEDDDFETKVKDQLEQLQQNLRAVRSHLDKLLEKARQLLHTLNSESRVRRSAIDKAVLHMQRQVATLERDALRAGDAIAEYVRCGQALQQAEKRLMPAGGGGVVPQAFLEAKEAADGLRKRAVVHRALYMDHDGCVTQGINGLLLNDKAKAVQGLARSGCEAAQVRTTRYYGELETVVDAHRNAKAADYIPGALDDEDSEDDFEDDFEEDVVNALREQRVAASTAKHVQRTDGATIRELVSEEKQVQHEIVDAQLPVVADGIVHHANGDVTTKRKASLQDQGGGEESKREVTSTSKVIRMTDEMRKDPMWVRKIARIECSRKVVTPDDIQTMTLAFRGLLIDLNPDKDILRLRSGLKTTVAALKEAFAMGWKPDQIIIQNSSVEAALYKKTGKSCLIKDLYHEARAEREQQIQAASPRHSTEVTVKAALREEVTDEMREDMEAQVQAARKGGFAP